MYVGALTSKRKNTRRKQIVVYLILLFIIISVLNFKQEFKANSIRNPSDDKRFGIEQANDMMNFSLINNDLNIFYKDIIIKDDLAIVNNKFTIIIFNITNQEEPKILSESKRCINEIMKMQVEDDMVFIGYDFIPQGSSMAKIQAFNISDSTTIEPIGCFLYYRFIDFVIEGNHGYVSTLNNKMLIISVQDPTNMYIVGELGGFTSGIYRLVVSGNNTILYNNEYFAYVLFIDTSDKENPTLAYFSTDYHSIIDASIVNDVLFLLSTNSLIAIRILDISSPLLLNSYYVSYTDSLYINEDIVFIDSSTRITIVNVSDVFDFDLITYHFLKDLNVSYVSSLDFHGDYIYFTCGLGGISVYNTTEQYNFEKLVQTGFEDGDEIYYENGLCYILEHERLNVLNASDLTNLTQIGSYELSSAIEMEIESNIAFIMTASRIEVLNVSDPTNITKTSEINVLSPRTLKVKNGLVSVLGNDLFLYNTTNPHAITLLDYVFEIDVYGNTIEMTNETIIVSDFGEIISFFDYSNPSDLQLIDILYTEEYYSIDETFLYGNYLFGASNWRDEILVLNLTSINNVNYFTLGEFSIGFNDIYIENDLMYLTSWYSPLLVYNISDLNDFSLQSEIDVLSQPIMDQGYRLAVENNTIFLLNGEGALQIIGLDSDNDYLADYLEEEIYLTTTGLQDSDSDLIVDGYEVYYGLDPLNISDASEDFDNDNLTNLEEFQHFSNPTLKDSDSDCLLDNDEITIYNTNLTASDTDLDLLVDGYEVLVSFTNPLHNDSDSDRLLDGEEVLYHSTDPTNNDTDADGMDDYFEVQYHLNPLDPSDKYLDLDLDGLLNIEEYSYNTRPDSADTDRDSYSDFEEIEFGSDPLDPLDFPDYSKTFTTSFAGFEGFTVLITTISVFSIITIYIQFRKNRGERVD